MNDFLKELENAKWLVLQEEWDRLLIKSFYTTQQSMWLLITNFIHQNKITESEFYEHIVRIPCNQTDRNISNTRFIAKNFAKMNELLYTFADSYTEKFDQLVRKFSAMKQAVDPIEHEKQKRESREKAKSGRSYHHHRMASTIAMEKIDNLRPSNWKVCK